jgi:hypothetical protein
LMVTEGTRPPLSKSTTVPPVLEPNRRRRILVCGRGGCVGLVDTAARE